jgi:transcriptional regulator with XRE-family HTH domain
LWLLLINDLLKNMKSYLLKFGQAVRKTREAAGLSQEELAHRSGLHRTYVSDVERGTRNLSLWTVKRLCDALGMPASRILAMVEEKSPLSTRAVK